MVVVELVIVVAAVIVVVAVVLVSLVLAIVVVVVPGPVPGLVPLWTHCHVLANLRTCTTYYTICVATIASKLCLLPCCARVVGSQPW